MFIFFHQRNHSNLKTKTKTTTKVRSELNEVRETWREGGLVAATKSAASKSLDHTKAVAGATWTAVSERASTTQQKAVQITTP